MIIRINNIEIINIDITGLNPESIVDSQTISNMVMENQVIVDALNKKVIKYINSNSIEFNIYTK